MAAVMDDLAVPLPTAAAVEPDAEQRNRAGPSRLGYANLHDIQPEIIIIGGGIAGCALAYSLATSARRRVLLLERDLREPDRIVGELLQPGGIAALHALGLGRCLEGIDAARVEGYCIVNGEDCVGAPYPALERMSGVEVGGVVLPDSEPETGMGAGAYGASGGRAREGLRRRGRMDVDDDMEMETDGGSSEGGESALSTPPSSVDSAPPRFVKYDGASTPTASNAVPSSTSTSTSTSTDPWSVPSASGRKEGRSFHHGRLISSLRRACLEAGPNLVVLEATVKDLVRFSHTGRVIGVSAGFKVPVASSSGSASGSAEVDAPAPADADTSATATTTTSITRNVYAPLTIVADGCFSKFRSVPGSRVPKPDTRSHFVGVILKNADMPMKYHGTVSLTPGGPVLMYQIGDKAEETRMLVDVKGKLPNNADGSLKRHLIDTYVPHLLPSLRPSVLAALETQRIRVMPNSFLPPSMQGLSSCPAGMLMVGDAWNMRHPLTGGGMTVAFNDAVLLRTYLGPERLGEGREGLEDWDRVSEGVREWFWKRKEVSGVVNVLSMALYSLFGGADEPDFEVLRHGCFKYFELGGKRISEPVGLLSVLAPTPFILFYHFFCVAFYSIFLLVRDGLPPAPGTEKPGRGKGKSKAARAGWVQRPGLALYSVKVVSGPRVDGDIEAEQEWKSVELTVQFWTACVVLLPVIFTEFKI